MNHQILFIPRPLFSMFFLSWILATLAPEFIPSTNPGKNVGFLPYIKYCFLDIQQNKQFGCHKIELLMLKTFDNFSSPALTTHCLNLNCSGLV